MLFRGRLVGELGSAAGVGAAPAGEGVARFLATVFCKVLVAQVGSRTGYDSSSIYWNIRSKCNW